MTPNTIARLSLAALICGAALVACGGGGGGSDSTPLEAAEARRPTPLPATPPQTPPVVPLPAPTAADRIAVGEKLFHDPALSGSGRLACSSCHVAERGHADAAGSFLPLGGVRLDQQGLRSSPTLRYLDAAGAFRFDAQGQPRGGLFWDGRASSRAEQARGPLLGAAEMANPSVAAVAAALRTRPYLAELNFAYALPANANDAQLFDALLQALSDYQAGDPDYEPFTSKFDAVQAGRATFTPQEARGLAAFNDPRRGNCASCHTSNGNNGQPALFTNFGYFALAAPRNQSAATLNPLFFDLGLCGPQRTDLSARTDLCGLFKVPTLRNVALTAPYFHNGVLATLEQVVDFYATRDTDPARWYPSIAGQVQRYNDLPPVYQANVEQRPPFGRRAGQQGAFSPQDAQDIVAFLRTLSDGFTP